MCLTHDLWHELSARIEDYLAGITLGGLIERQNVQAVVLRQQSQSDKASLLPVSSVSS
jgi:Rrf2 family iron-sulfur cluster assembly transcriptional regulator